MRRVLSSAAVAIGLCVVASTWGLGQDAERNGLDSSVRTVNGTPALFVNGRQESLILAAPYQQGPRDVNTFRTGGIEIFNFYLHFPWTGPDQWAFSRPDAKLDEYLSIDPNALFLPRILLTPGAWFGQMYPDEITQRDDGTAGGTFGRGTHPSFSSEAYHRRFSHELMIGPMKRTSRWISDRPRKSPSFWMKLRSHIAAMASQCSTLCSPPKSNETWASSGCLGSLTG